MKILNMSAILILCTFFRLISGEFTDSDGLSTYLPPAEFPSKSLGNLTPFITCPVGYYRDPRGQCRRTWNKWCYNRMGFLPKMMQSFPNIDVQVNTVKIHASSVDCYILIHCFSIKPLHNCWKVKKLLVLYFSCNTVLVNMTQLMVHHK